MQLRQRLFSFMLSSNWSNSGCAFDGTVTTVLGTSEKHSFKRKHENQLDSFRVHRKQKRDPRNICNRYIITGTVLW